MGGEISLTEGEDSLLPLPLGLLTHKAKLAPGAMMLYLAQKHPEAGLYSQVWHTHVFVLCCS